MKIYTKIVEWISLIMMALSSAAAAFTVVLVTVDVLGRLIFSRAIVGATELTQLLFILMVLGIPAAALREEHISVPLFTDMMPKIIRVIINLISVAATVVVCIGIAYSAFKMVGFSRMSGAAYSMIGVPEWPLLIAFGAAFVAAALAFVLQIKRDLAREYKGVSMPETMFFKRELPGEGEAEAAEGGEGE